MSMYYNQYAAGDANQSLLGDPLAPRREDDYSFNQSPEFGREGLYPANTYSSYDSFDDRRGYPDNLQVTGGYSRQESFEGGGGFNSAPGILGAPPVARPEDANYFRQAGIVQTAMPYSTAGYEQQNFALGADPGIGAYDNRRDTYKDLDRERERDRDRNRRSQGRDRQGNSHRDDSWDRSSRRDRNDRDSDRDRRREKRRDRSARDRSPRDDGSEVSGEGAYRMDLGEDDYRDQSPNRDRHRDHRQDADYDRERDRDRSYRDRDRDRSRRDDRDRDMSRSGDRDGERWMTEEPSATILLRGLTNGVVENDVIQVLISMGMTPKDVRFMRRVTGASRGFGFVEFQSQSEAQRWMDLNQGQLQLPGNTQRISMHYSAPRVSRSLEPASRVDWMCKCGAHNFRRRDFCYKCSTNRRLAEDPLCGVTELDPATHVGKNPCNTLLFRDLDALTTEQGVLQAIAALTSLAIKNTQVVRDEMSTSLCFGFLELNSVASAKQLHDFLQAQNPPLAIDGKQVMVSYAKNTFNTSLDIIVKAQQKLAQNQYYLNYSYGQGQDNGEYYNYSQYYGTQQTAATTTASAVAPANSTNAAAAVAQTAIMQAHAAKTLATASSTTTTATQETSQLTVYPTPDVSTYQYDKTSGYYYDPSTGLYYEPNTQYYYNAKTTQWMYWDAEKSTYLPAPSQSSDGTQQQVPSEMDSSQLMQGEKFDKEEKKEKEKTKVAKKIAKDMEKWAKAMNAQKDAIKEEQRKSTIAAGRKESAAADAGFAILQKSKEDIKLMPPPTLTLNPAPEVAVPPAPAGGAKAGLVASYGGDSDDSGDEDDSGVVDESKLVDWSKLACLLCKRQFQSREILTKHTQFSDLHKQNLENLRVKSAGKVEKKEYRDRAKERRQKYGMPAPPEPGKQAGVANEQAEVFEQPTKMGIGSENIGNKMLQKMGWTAGLGLGKSNQGRTAPVETQRRAATAGLGARGADIVAEEGATYKENVKKTLFARYNDTE